MGQLIKIFVSKLLQMHQSVEICQKFALFVSAYANNIKEIFPRHFCSGIQELNSSAAASQTIVTGNL